MFKKLLTISVAVLVLAGCDKKNNSNPKEILVESNNSVKNVTTDFLMGDWNCVQVHFSAESSGDDDFVYEYVVTDAPYGTILTKLNDTHYMDETIDPNDNPVGIPIAPYKNKNIYKEGTQEEHINTFDYIYKYINDDKFIYHQVSSIFWTYKHKSFSHNRQTSCFRVK